MILVLASFRLPADHVAEARVLVRDVVAQTRAEAGCIAYDVCEDVLEPGLFRVNESWEDREALSAHLAAPHMAEWGRVRADMGMTERKVTIYDIAGAQEL